MLATYLVERLYQLDASEREHALARQRLVAEGAGHVAAREQIARALVDLAERIAPEVRSAEQERPARAA